MSAKTLPDYLASGLRLVFVGTNPGLYSAETGHYFATPRNRFWRAMSLAQLVEGDFGPEHDHLLQRHGIGFTDLVKRPTSGAAELTAQDFRQGAPILKEKLLRYQPKIVSFHGVMAYGNYLKFAESAKERLELGMQSRTIGRSRIFVTPNPSPANAAYSLDALAEWYLRLKEAVQGPIAHA